ncbi:hypothetical protein JTE90_004218 [Oedothorax gibbosus]|uniref:Uncharacterized protein n=1 Tax=Oedothorax gibbosus TaxID=931172 RepID=A0AAV6TD81_9ARAC|nr:hypothetical protein JTE90_004218 [Oedothorax gibbosus]
MNFSRYAAVYSRFHGATSYRTEQDIIILDLFEEPFQNWILLRMLRFDDIHMRPENAFAQALQMFLQSQSPLTVFCQNDTWIALSGREKYITPIVSEQANFQMYATPYFVRDPSALSNHMQAHHSDTVFQYKNCIVYLDRQDLPYPGGCYFSSSTVIPPSLYRICVLSREPHQVALSVATEWETRRDVLTMPFPTTDATHIPAMIQFLPVDLPYLANERVLSSGNIQKRLSLYQPQCLIQDILLSYLRNKELEHTRGIGLIIEWPFRIPFEGTRSTTTEQAAGIKKFVALVVNAHTPTRILLVRYPYEVYTEYDQVPTIPYIAIHFSPTILQLPPDMQKVSIDATVIGYEYEKGFYCFSFPFLEGCPTEDKARHLDCVVGTVRNAHPDDTIQATFRVDDTLILHHVYTKSGVSEGWRLEKCKDRVPEFPKIRVLATPLLARWAPWV